MIELDYLTNMISRETLDTMAGKHKFAYKLCLCAIFNNIITGNHYTKVQEVAILAIEQIKQSNRKTTNFDELSKKISEEVFKTFDKNHFMKPYNENLINKVVTCFRDKLKDLREKGVSLFQVEEITDFIDVKKFLGHSCISYHHWLEFSLLRHLTITVPEAIIFNDLKVQWNYFVEVNSILKKGQSKITSRNEELEYYKEEETRNTLYRYSALYRNLIILSVSFVEAYLYNLFYCINTGDIPHKDKVIQILQYKKIEDTQIIKQVLYPLFPEIEKSISSLFSQYKRIVKYRDRYIHASSFIDQANKSSELEPLLRLNAKELIDSLQTSIDFVIKLNELLPENLKILFWWYDGVVQFDRFEPLMLTNAQSPINRNEYLNI